MTIIDRYVLRMFVKILCICFVSLTGLYIVIDVFNNLDEFINLGKTQGGFLKVLSDYYVGRSFLFFDMTSNLLALTASIFVLTSLQRSNELASIMAGGVPMRRVIKPMIAAVFVVSIIGLVNREVMIPRYRDNLVRNAQNWKGDAHQSFKPQYDYQTNILLSGNGVIRNENKIVQPNFRLPSTLRGFSNKITAAEARYLEANDQHAAGYLLVGVTFPEDIDKLESLSADDIDIVRTQSDTPWLLNGECFVPSHLNFEQLSGGDALRHYASSVELMSGLRNPSLEYNGSSRVAIHARFLQPILDMTLVLIGIPIIMAKRDRNIFVAAGYCLLLVAGFLAIVMTCHQLGATGLVKPVTGAWAPLILFGPVAVVSVYSLKQ